MTLFKNRPVFASIYRKFKDYGFPGRLSGPAAFMDWQLKGAQPGDDGVRYSIQNATEHDDDGPLDLLIMDDIGENWLGDGITAKDVIQTLQDNPGRDINVRINSFGGAVFEGIGIFNALAGRNTEVNTAIEGMAASTAGFISQVGDKRMMYDNTMIMLHKAWTFMFGNEDEFRDQADILAKVDTLIADIYALRSGKTRVEVRDLMQGVGSADGVWLLPEEALDYGFVDHILSRERDDETQDRGSSVVRNDGGLSVVLGGKDRTPGSVTTTVNGKKVNEYTPDSKEAAQAAFNERTKEVRERARKISIEARLERLRADRDAILNGEG